MIVLKLRIFSFLKFPGEKRDRNDERKRHFVTIIIDCKKLE